jgi:hypothetical protein
MHVIMYASILLLEIALLTLVRKSIPTEGSDEAAPERRDETAESHYAIHAAKWTAGVSLAITLLCMTAMSLLTRPLDRPGTLKIDNRYIRLAPRVLVAVIIACVPIAANLSIEGFLSVMMYLLWAVSVWEWGAGLESSGKIFESKRIE